MAAQAQPGQEVIAVALTEFKAISQNIGHDHAMTTYNSYGKLTEGEQLDVIAGIGESDADLGSIPMEEILAEIARRAGK